MPCKLGQHHSMRNKKFQKNTTQYVNGTLLWGGLGFNAYNGTPCRSSFTTWISTKRENLMLRFWEIGRGRGDR